MKLYMTLIGIGMLTISCVNIAFDVAPWYTVILLVIFCTAVQFALDGLLALVIGWLPDKLFGADNRLYRVSEGEKRLYKKLKVRSWKDKVWELGGLGGFSKKSLANPGSAQYIEQFIIECNKGVLTHRLSYPIGFLAMLMVPDGCALPLALPVAAVNMFLNILPTLALRYNTPKLRRMLERLRKKEKQKS